MNLNSIAVEFDQVVERCSEHGMLDLAEPAPHGSPRWTGDVVEFGDHASVTLHGLREEQVRAVLAALGGGGR